MQLTPLDHHQIPTYDFFEREIESDFYIEDVLDNFVFSMEEGYFLTWEAVVAKEQKKRLTKIQKEAFSEIISFGPHFYEPIIYINEIARPNKPWYLIAKEISEKLVLKQRITSYGIHDSLWSEGWSRLKECILDYGEGLSKPKGVKKPIKVIPDEIRHQLEIQEAVVWLFGLGQSSEWNLDNPEEQYRIKDIITSLKNNISSVKYLKLSLHKLLTDFIELPPKDEEIFKREMIDRLGLIDENEEMTAKLKKKKKKKK